MFSLQPLTSAIYTQWWSPISWNGGRSYSGTRMLNYWPEPMSMEWRYYIQMGLQFDNGRWHSSQIQQAAIQAGMDTQAFCDMNCRTFEVRVPFAIFKSISNSICDIGPSEGCKHRQRSFHQDHRPGASRCRPIFLGKLLCSVHSRARW